MGGVISHEKNIILREMSEQHNQTLSLFIRWAWDIAAKSQDRHTHEPAQPTLGDRKLAILRSFCSLKDQVSLLVTFQRTS